MNDRPPVTTRDLLDTIQEVRPHVEALTQRYETAANRYVLAKRAYEEKEALEFIKAKEGGATNEHAARLALIKSSDERQEMDTLLEQKRAAKVGMDGWGSYLEAISSTSFALNRELKTFASAGGA